MKELIIVPNNNDVETEKCRMMYKDINRNIEYITNKFKKDELYFILNKLKDHSGGLLCDFIQKIKNEDIPIVNKSIFPNDWEIIVNNFIKLKVKIVPKWKLPNRINDNIIENIMCYV